MAICGRDGTGRRAARQPTANCHRQYSRINLVDEISPRTYLRGDPRSTPSQIAFEGVEMSTTETYRPDWLGGPPPKTHVRLDGAGEARWFVGMLAVIKSRPEETAGLLTTLEIVAPPGAAAPLHTHHAEDEGFLVLEGEVTFQVGDDIIEAKAGDWLFGPRDVPHRFEVGPNGARMFWTLTPGGFDRFVVAASEPARELAPPPSFAPDEAFLAWLTQVAADHSITLHL